MRREMAFMDNAIIININCHCRQLIVTAHIRRLTTEYYNKPASGRPYLVWEIRCAASIDYTMYNKHRELFTEVVSNHNREVEHDNV